MSDTRSDRLAAGAGILAAALLAGGFVLIGVDGPGPDATRSEIVATYTDDATNARHAIGLLLTGLGGMCFLPFLGYLRKVVTRTTAEASILPATALAAGVLLVAGVFASAAMEAVVSGSDFFDSYRVDADIVMTTVVAGFIFNGLATMAGGGVLIGAVALAAHRSRLLPRWVTVLGFAVAVLAIPAALVGMWLLVEALWIAIAAGLLARRRAAQRTSVIRAPGGATA